MSLQPTAGIPRTRKNQFAGGVFGSTSPASSPPADSASTPRDSDKPRGGTPQRRRGASADSRDNVQEPEPTAQARTPQGRPTAERKDTAARARSSSQDRERIIGTENDGYAHVLNVIRRNMDDRGRPLIKACILLNEFAKKKTGRTNEHCDEMLSAILESLADGRKVDGKDVVMHIDGVAEKLQDRFGDDFSNGRMEAYRAALADAISLVARNHPGLLMPWARDPDANDPTKNYTRDWRKKAEKRSYFSASELADKIIGGVTKTRAADTFMVSRKVRNMQHVTDAIRRMKAELGEEKPIFNELCAYLLSHERPEITEANANVLLSAMTKAYFRRGTNDETGKMQSSFVIPKTAPFMQGADKLTWYKKDKTGKNIGDALSFKSEGNNWVVNLEHRRHLLDLVFPKEQQEIPVSPAGAAIGLLAEMVKADEKKE